MDLKQPIEYCGERVLTTAQIAEAYGVEPIKIQQNFSNHKDRYIPGKHYVCLEGQDLKQFKDHFENFEMVDKRASKLYLWTKKGAFMHAKSLNTDQAWLMYDSLVDRYFELEASHQAPSHFALPKTWAETLRLYADEVDRRVEVERHLAIAAPKADNYNLFANTEGFYSMDDLATLYHSNGSRLACDVYYSWGEGSRIAPKGAGITTVVLYSMCREVGLIYKKSTCPTKRAMDKNWLVRIMRSREHNGTQVQKPQTYVTGNGVFAVFDLLYKHKYITHATLDLSLFTQHMHGTVGQHISRI